MKKMLLATALALLITGCCSTDVYCSKQTGGGGIEAIASNNVFWNWAEEKLSMQPKFVAAQKCVQNRNPANIRKWIARFYYFRHLYSAGSVLAFAHNGKNELPIDMGNSICTAH